MRPIIDAHLDIAWNAMSYDRDQLLSLADMRAVEDGMTGKSRGNCTVSLPEMRRANIGVCLATMLARTKPQHLSDDYPAGSTVADRTHGEVILREDLDFANQTITSANAQSQMIYYELLESDGHIRMIRTAADLDAHWRTWLNDPGATPIGYILSMEGTDPIIKPRDTQWWFDKGLRTACLAHYGPSAYAMGTGGDGEVTTVGFELLKEFDRLGIILDLVHTADTAVRQAMDTYGGPVFVSHGNCRALVDRDRQFSDDQIRAISGRGGVFGVVLDAWMLKTDFDYSAPNSAGVTLHTLVDHVDHFCQIAGNANHVAIGSDLDGGFGFEETPKDFKSISDLHDLAPILADRGYSDADIDAIFWGNWLRFFKDALPK